MPLPKLVRSPNVDIRSAIEFDFAAYANWTLCACCSQSWAKVRNDNTKHTHIRMLVHEHCTNLIRAPKSYVISNCIEHRVLQCSENVEHLHNKYAYVHKAHLHYYGMCARVYIECCLFELRKIHSISLSIDWIQIQSSIRAGNMQKLSVRCRLLYEYCSMCIRRKCQCFTRYFATRRCQKQLRRASERMCVLVHSGISLTARRGNHNQCTLYRSTLG